MDTKPPLVISFFTKNTPYEQEAEKFITACKNYGIEHEVEGIESKGAWDRNCAMKPRFIINKLKEKKRSVLWVDIDGRFHKKLDPYDWTKADISLRIRQGLNRGNSNKVCSATLYCSFCKEVIDLLEDWDFLCQDYLVRANRNIEVWDQIVLQEALENHPAVRVDVLAVKFCAISDLDVNEIVQEQIVIQHTQASRKFKAAVNNEDEIFAKLSPNKKEILDLIGIVFYIEVDAKTLKNLETCLKAFQLFWWTTTVYGQFEDLPDLIEFLRISSIYPRCQFICNRELLPKSRYRFQFNADHIVDATKLSGWFLRHADKWEHLFPLQFGEDGPLLIRVGDTSDPHVVQEDIFADSCLED